MSLNAYLLVFLGSAVGGVARFWASGALARYCGESFPAGTLFVNVTGSFVIGVLGAMAEPSGRFVIGPGLRLFLMVGVLGGYTTFSSFSLQTLNLLQDGEWLYATVNVTASVAGCLLSVWLGHSAGAYLGLRN